MSKGKKEGSKGKKEGFGAVGRWGDGVVGGGGGGWACATLFHCSTVPLLLFEPVQPSRDALMTLLQVHTSHRVSDESLYWHYQVPGNILRACAK